MTTTDRGRTSPFPHDDVGKDAFRRQSCAPSRWRYVVPVGLVLLIMLVFMTALDAGLVYWDDDDLLINNTRYQVLNSENLKWIFTTSYAGHFQPLTWLTYSLDFAIWGIEPLGYHLTNVLFHAITAVTFYFLTRMLLSRATGSMGLARSRPFVLSAACAAALFALHPLRAESVAWLAERRDVVSGFFYVLAVVCYLRYASLRGSGSTGALATDSKVGPTPGRSAADSAMRPVGGSVGRRRLWYTGVVVSCVLSLLAKASAVTLPLVLLILDVYPLRRIGGTMGWWRRSTARVWIEKLPLFVVALVAGVRAVVAQAEGGDLIPYESHGLLARIAQASYGLTFYLGKTIWPTNLGPLYELPASEVLLGPRLWVSLVIIAGLALAAFLWRRRFPAIPVALAAYGIVLSPVLGFAQSGPQLVADRYSYLSCMGLAVLAGAGVLQCFRSGSWWAVGHRRAVLGVLLAGIIAVLQWATFRQADIWKSPLALWQHGVAVSPGSSIANINYADALAAAEGYDPAAYYYERGLKINPDDPVGLHHYADLLKRLGNKKLAAEYYREALSIDPQRHRACRSLAQLLFRQNLASDAVAVLRDGVRRHPLELPLIEDLAALLSAHPDDRVRNGEEAVSLALRVSRIRGPDDAHGFLMLATALAEAKRFDEAVATAERALDLAERKHKGALAARIRFRLALFRTRQPYRLGQRQRDVQTSKSQGVETPG